MCFEKEEIYMDYVDQYFFLLSAKSKGGRIANIITRNPKITSLFTRTYISGYAKSQDLFTAMHTLYKTHRIKVPFKYHCYVK